MINERIVISGDTGLIDALNIMDQEERKLLIVCEGTTFMGVISIGDVQRAILNKRELSDPVKSFLRKKVTFAYDYQDIGAIKERMHKNRIECMPIVDSNNQLVDIVEWSDLFDEKTEKTQYCLSNPVY